MKLCPKCPNPCPPGQRYCKACHARYMRAWRTRKRQELIQLRADLAHLRAREQIAKMRTDAKASG